MDLHVSSTCPMISSKWYLITIPLKMQSVSDLPAPSSTDISKPITRRPSHSRYHLRVPLPQRFTATTKTISQAPSSWHRSSLTGRLFRPIASSALRYLWWTTGKGFLALSRRGSTTNRHGASTTWSLYGLLPLASKRIDLLPWTRDWIACIWGVAIYAWNGIGLVPSGFRNYRALCRWLQLSILLRCLACLLETLQFLHE